MKRTPLYDKHVAAGARMIEFGGWEMPVSYTDITTEHHVVRRACGLFDLCHMGRVSISGPQARELVQRVQTNDLDKIPLGKIRYAMMLLENGGVIDDILVHHRASDVFLVVNASNRERDVEQLRRVGAGLQVTIDDQSDRLAMIAVQGPQSAGVLKRLTNDIDIEALKYYSLAEGHVLGEPAMVTRTGYTGEDGFEIYVAVPAVGRVWDACLEKGSDFGITPCGLGARDTLRLEAGMPLYGHEITETINPLEAGLEFGVRLTKADFVGLAALRAVAGHGVERKLVGLEIEGRRIPRQGYPVLVAGEPAGFVASGTWSPTFDRAIATALVSTRALGSGGPIAVDVRGKPAAARIVGLPFYKRDGSGSLGK